MSDDDERISMGEDEDDQEEDEEVALGPAALGLHRVGTKMPTKRPKTKPMQALNARGMPARLRKKKNFYDDQVEDVKPRLSPLKKAGGTTSASSSPQKTLKRPAGRQSTATGGDDDLDDLEFTPSSRPVKKEKLDIVEHIVNFDAMDEQEMQVNTEIVGRRLKNLLKLPKAHKFVMFEWFYSNLDQVLFKGENDFQVCVRDSFPQLAARQLSRVEWSMIRRLMGKPRRCSQVRKTITNYIENSSENNKILYPLPLI